MTDAELIYLQFRKVLELIALSSLSANRKKHEETTKKFHKKWNADKIVKHLDKINHNFYPIPTKQVIDPKTGKVIKVDSIKEGFLTKEEFTRILGLCGDFLHGNNPSVRKSLLI